MPWQDFVKRFLKKKVISEDILVAGYLNSKFISSSTPVLLLRCNSFIQSFSWGVKVSYNTGLRLVLVSRPVQKSVRIRSFSGPYFSTFGLNRGRYGVSLRIQSKCWKIRTRKTTNTDTFVVVRVSYFSCNWTGS